MNKFIDKISKMLCAFTIFIMFFVFLESCTIKDYPDSNDVQEIATEFLGHNDIIFEKQIFIDKYNTISFVYDMESEEFLYVVCKYNFFKWKVQEIGVVDE